MKVTVEKLSGRYSVLIERPGYATTFYILGREEYESLILQLTGQLAKLDQEDA